MDENTGSKKVQNEIFNEGKTPKLKEKQPGFNWFFEELLGKVRNSSRLGVNLFSFGLILVVVLAMSTFYLPRLTPASGSGQATLTPTVEAIPTTDQTLQNILLPLTGITRGTSLHTNIPSRPRMEVIQYTVQSGDSVFGIADKFGLKPSTILWGNYSVLKDSPDSLRVGQNLNILPTDGTYHQWQVGEGLNSVAKYYGVDPDTIINYPGNHLNPDAIGDFANPNISPGTWLIIPGGYRQIISWSAPIGVTRDNPAMASILGAGWCGVVQGGAVGYGTFVWPALRHYLSGTDYAPEINHRGIDISGMLGSPVFAADAGVIVYAGWNDYGYGNMIIIDHGNKWQTLYAHLSEIDVSCAQSVGQGDTIAKIGSTGNSTGPHLHFEIMNTVYGKVNPWNFLP